MSVREYAVLYLGPGSSPGPGTASGGNAITPTATHALDSGVHSAASDGTRLDSSASAHGLLPKLSGDAADVLLGDGTWGPAGGAGSGDTVGQFIAGWDGGLSNLVSGKDQDIVAPYTGTLTGWTMLADTTGSAVVDVATDTYAGFPTFTSIVASAPPTISGAAKAQSSTLTGWTLAVTAGDVLRFTLSSVSGLRRLLVVLGYSRP